MEERYLSLSEAADALDISERTAYRWIKSGKLRAYKPGRDYRIPEAALKEAVEGSEVHPKEESRSSHEPTLFNGVDAERRTPVLAKALATQAGAWLRAVADATTDLDTALGIVTAAADLENLLSIILGDEESSKGLSWEDIGEIARAMKLLEDVAAQYGRRLARAIEQAPPDEVEKYRQRKAKFAELERPRSRRSATS